MKAMLSQPMAGKTEEEIVVTRERAITVLESMGYEVVNTLFTDGWFAPENLKASGVKNVPLCFLSSSLSVMSKCDAAYFCKGWENARGCQIEHAAAKKYGLTILYEDAPESVCQCDAKTYIGVKRLKAFPQERDGAFIAAASPDVVLSMIERIERLEEDFDAAARSAADESVKAVQLEEEAQFLAIRCERLCNAVTCCDDCPYQDENCPEQTIETIDGAEWRKKARRFVEVAHADEE